MPNPLPNYVDSSRLCGACGLCCREELFDCVWIEEDERERLEALGMPVHRSEDTRLQFDLPCRRYSGRCCEIYSERPSTCRAFRCKLLKAYEAGTVDETNALERLSEAHVLIKKARALLDPGQILRPATWKAMVDRWHRESGTTNLSQSFAAKFLALTRLNRFLDIHFRNEAQQVVKGDHSGN